MNNLIKISVLFLLFSCNSLKKEKLSIKVLKANYKVVIKFSKDNAADIISVKIPTKISIKNLNNSEVNFNTVEYKYQDSLSNWANRNLSLYVVENFFLKKISNFKKKKISNYEENEYMIYSRHFLDSSKATQKQFRPYIKRMLTENKDTLHIGTVKEFKKNHKELFEKLTKNDSISIQFLDGNNLGERVTVPVEW